MQWPDSTLKERIYILFSKIEDMKIVLKSFFSPFKPEFFGQHFQIQDLKMKQLCPYVVG